MIREWLESWLTPASPAAKRLGYLYESVALGARHRRHASSWASHLEHCHRTMLQAVRGQPRHGSLVILGSGRLLEIPLVDLKPFFSKIVLVDLVHPRAVRRAWGGRKDVVLAERDLLGWENELLAWAPGAPLPVPKPPDLREWEPDVVISANCLSQLALIPRQRIEKIAAGSLSEERLDEFSRAISAAHLGQIRAARRPHLIIADFETLVRDRDGRVVQSAKPYFDPAALKKHEEWVWHVAPRGELDRRHEAEMRVGAFTLRP